MSRSIRKTPIFGKHGIPSEAVDKRIWHKRMRTREREQAANEAAQSDTLSVRPKDVSNTRTMAKQGKRYKGSRKQVEQAVRYAALRGQTPVERTALVVRKLAKIRAK